MIEILTIALKNKIVRQILIILGLILMVGGVFALLTYRKNQAEKEAKAAQAEANRLKSKSEGLQILVNTANSAKEVENERKIANQQEINSNIANSIYSNSFKRDSSEFSDDPVDAVRRYCQHYKNTDTRCQSFGFNAQ